MLGKMAGQGWQPAPAREILCQELDQEEAEDKSLDTMYETWKERSKHPYCQD